ncbi:hypothetical protein [Azomonas macrocytogenes]|uniref:ATP-dependent protease HslVU (ClpYQ) peptidase subunit n=1 Tax=Azomonas macrocytogenes TaxID=69962 RepID=A0A839SYE1_AZOMA|nr:hypothetical protein [Azomonas macrocytogenes]MBB3102371.1 ATP-dependent protease HslVU (ClpYQ) peptidase subunit [Azomonas macrocytogenes]
MKLDLEAFESLLKHAQTQADRAALENQPQLYRDAFETTLQAMRLLAEESGTWRHMVVRATEEYQGDEGI